MGIREEELTQTGKLRKSFPEEVIIVLILKVSAFLDREQYKQMH